MTRHEYTESRWRGWVASATRSKRGQKLFREMLAAMDSLPMKRLIGNEFANDAGEYCALGCVGTARGMDMLNIDPEAWDQVAEVLDVSAVLVREIASVNDDVFHELPEARWIRMRSWVAGQLKEPT